VSYIFYRGSKRPCATEGIQVGGGAARAECESAVLQCLRVSIERALDSEPVTTTRVPVEVSVRNSADRAHHFSQGPTTLTGIPSSLSCQASGSTGCITLGHAGSMRY